MRTIMEEEEIELRLPSDIEDALAKQEEEAKAAKERGSSILDQAEAYQEKNRVESRSRRQVIGIHLNRKSKLIVLDAARALAEEGLRDSKFPELSSVSTEDELALEYLIKRDEYEQKHSSKQARLAINYSAWINSLKKPIDSVAVGTPTETKGEEATQTKESSKDVEEPKIVEEVHEEEIKVEPILEGLDETQLEILKEIRARRGRRGTAIPK